MFKQHNVIGLGMHAIEQVVRLKDFGAAPHTQICSSWNYELVEGGFMGNLLIGLARLGLSTGYLGKVGGDRFGIRLMKSQITKSIDLSYCEIIPTLKTANSWCIIDEKGEQRRILFPNILTQIDEEFIMQHVCYIKSCQLLIIDVSVIPLSTCVLAVEIAKSELIPVIVCLNIPESELFGSLKSATLAELEELISFSDLFLASPGDLQELAPMKDPLEQAEYLRRKYLIPHIVLLETLKGCVYATEEKIAYSPAFDVEAVDPLGCRNAFEAGLSFGFFQNWGLSQSTRFANACAALNSLSLGAHNGMKTEAEVMQFLAKQH